MELDKIDISKLSHEIRHSFTILNSLAALINTSEIDEMQQSLISEIEEQSAAVSKLLEDATTLWRLDNKRLIAKKRSVSLPTIISQFIESSGFSPQVHLITSGSGKVSTDPELFEMIIAELVDNARRFSMENSTVIIRVLDENNKVKVTITDQGWGFNTSNEYKLSQPFEHGVDQASGAGLGLTKVHKLADLLGISFNIDGRAGSGTVATLTLDVS